jgi:hypothetical protein
MLCLGFLFYWLVGFGISWGGDALNHIYFRYFLMLCLGFLFYWLVGFGISWGGDAGHFSGALYFLTIGNTHFFIEFLKSFF